MTSLRETEGGGPNILGRGLVDRDFSEDLALPFPCENDTSN